MSVLQRTESGVICVAYVQLVAKETDSLDYTTYIFKCLDDETNYVMCTRYPNWNHKKLVLGEQGYLTYKIVQAGIDTWFDGRNQIPYKYTSIQFLKFVKKPENIDKEYIM